MMDLSSLGRYNSRMITPSCTPALKLSFLALLLSSCGLAGNTDPASSEWAHALGDIMGSADEALARSPLAFQAPPLPWSERLWAWTSEWILPVAVATGNCYSESLGSCLSGERKVTYSRCTLGPWTLSGEVAFRYSGGSLCSVRAVGDFVRRIPDFSVEGRSGATLNVSVLDENTGGQRLERTGASSFSYAVEGLRRSIDEPTGQRSLDLTFSTSEDMQITGLTRANRTLTGGTLQITDNTSSEVVSVSPNALRWNGTCSCPVSGSWVGQRRDAGGVTEDFVVRMESCGNAEVTLGSQTSTVIIERCVGI